MICNRNAILLRRIAGAVLILVCVVCVAGEPPSREDSAKYEELAQSGYSAIPELIRAMATAETNVAISSLGDALAATGPEFLKQPEYAAAMAEFRKTAEAGNVIAQRNLGLAYCIGAGVPQDDAEAAQWFRKAAEQGDAQGQYHLGVMYDNGEGVPQDHVEAAKWYRLAADQGFAWA